jgi:hypothetical protein
MKVDATILRRLAALNMPAECFAGVLAILADLQEADDARLENQRERTNRSRRKKRDSNSDSNSDSHVSVTLPDRDSHSYAPPHTPLKEENKIREPNGSRDAGPTQADLEKELFRRGRQVCGKASGGLIASLLKSRQHDVSLARSVLELAATKLDSREFVAAAIKKGTGYGQQKLNLSDLAHDLADEMRSREREAGISQPAPPVRGD